MAAKGRAICHNSVIFDAMTSRFCMVVHIDPPLFLPKKMAAKNQMEPNSVNFQGISYRVCMVVHNDPQIFLPKNKMATKNKMAAKN